MPQKPVGVTCDLSGTFNNGWTGNQPVWTFTPDSLQCQSGNNMLTWTLTANNVPAGFTAAFSNPGIVFKPTPPWTGSTPANQAGGTVTASDNFHHLTVSVTFGYTTSVTVTPNPGTNYPSATFTHDPDVENEAGGGLPASGRGRLTVVA